MIPEMFESEDEWRAVIRQRLIALEQGSDDLSELAGRLRASFDRVTASRLGMPAPASAPPRAPERPTGASDGPRLAP